MTGRTNRSERSPVRLFVVPCASCVVTPAQAGVWLRPEEMPAAGMTVCMVVMPRLVRGICLSGEGSPDVFG